MTYSPSPSSSSLWTSKAKTTPPTSSSRASDYSTLAPSNTVRTEEKYGRNGTLRLNHFDNEGRRIGTTAVGKDGSVLRAVRYNSDGTMTSMNARRGIERTYSAPGQPSSVVTKNLFTGETRSSYLDPASGNRRNYVSRNGIPYSYQTTPNAIPGTTTVIYDYRPGYVYSSHSDDFWFYMWLNQSMNNHSHNHYYSPGSYSSSYSSGGYSSGGYAGGSSASAPAPAVPDTVREIDYDWSTSDLKNLPTDLATTKKYTDPTDWITDDVVYGIINSMRSSAEAKVKSNQDNKKCGFFSSLFGCQEPPAEFSEVFLDKLRNYNLDYNLRAELHAHVVEILENIRQSKPVSIRDVLLDSSPEAKSQRLYVLQEDAELKDETTLEGCDVDSGDVIRLKAWYPGTEKVSVEIVKLISPDDQSCKEGSRATMNISSLQDLESDMAHRVELATIQSKTLLKNLRH